MTNLFGSCDCARILVWFSVYLATFENRLIILWKFNVDSFMVKKSKESLFVRSWEVSVYFQEFLNMAWRDASWLCTISENSWCCRLFVVLNNVVRLCCCFWFNSPLSYAWYLVWFGRFINGRSKFGSRLVFIHFCNKSQFCYVIEYPVLVFVVLIFKIQMSDESGKCPVSAKSMWTMYLNTI
jgi:hypothetical protein